MVFAKAISLQKINVAMAYKPIRMERIKLIHEYYKKGFPKKKIARLTGMSKNTVKHYIGIIESTGIDLEGDFSEVKKVLYSHHNRQNVKRDQQLEKLFPDIITELTKVGVNRQLLWKEYKDEHPEGFSYSRFCKKLKQYVARKNVTLRLEHKAGHALTIDFTGKKFPWIDPSNGQKRYAEVLVCTLPYSGITFACAVNSQKQEDFVYGINQALLHIGGLPKIVRSDNLKSFVIKSNRYEPAFNKLCVQMSSYYGFELDATRSYKPKDKAHVERHVSIVYTALFAPLRNKTFHSINAINQAFLKHLHILNSTNFQNKDYSRNDLFEKEEKPHLLPLPKKLFDVKKSTKGKVQRNYHVILGEDKHQYSVPYKYVGKTTEIMYDSQVVEIYIGLDRIAVHQRNMKKNAYTTKEEHMPEKHRKYLEQTKWDADYFLNQARSIGEYTLWAMSSILNSKPSFLDQTHKTCIGVLRLASRYSSQRLENACKKAQKTQKVTYRILENILRNKMDMAPDSEAADSFHIVHHGNVRGSKKYAKF